MLCFFKQKTADEMRISDWSSDVCSSDLERVSQVAVEDDRTTRRQIGLQCRPAARELPLVGMHGDEEGDATREIDVDQIVDRPWENAALYFRSIEHGRTVGRAARDRKGLV